MTAILERQGPVRDPTVKHAFERILIRLPDGMTGVLAVNPRVDSLGQQCARLIPQSAGLTQTNFGVGPQ